MQPESPLNSIPPVVIALCLILVGVEATLSLADAGIIGGPRGIGWRMAAVQDYGFTSAVLERVTERGDFSFDMIKRFVSYAFVNGSFTQTLFSAALVLALGKFVGETFGQIQVLIVFFASMVVGALVFGLFVSGANLLFGGFTPVYGLIGAYTYSIWLRLGAAGKNQLLAFRLIGVLLGIQLVFGLFFGNSPAWIAELAGFATGFSISVLLAPGGWTSFVQRMRKRS